MAIEPSTEYEYEFVNNFRIIRNSFNNFDMSTEPMAVEDGRDIKQGFKFNDEDTPHRLHMRLDWEFSNKAMEDTDNDRAWDLLCDQMSRDLADISINGDRDSDDPMLKIADGSAKTGKFLVDMKTHEIHLYREKYRRRGVHSYTVYVSAGFDWSR